jgi:DNA-binding transcriptional MerR regulator
MNWHDGTAGHAADRAQRLRTGKVASKAGVSIETLRYYERRGLLAPPDRNAAGHRQYPAHTVTLIRMVKNAQCLGLSLDEIASLITSGPDTDSISCIAERKVAEIDAQIDRLIAIRGKLSRYIR